MRLWFRYLREKRMVAALYLATVFLFVAVGSLYHIENLAKLLYAALLATVIWGIAFFLLGMKYVRRGRQLEAAFVHFEQTGELLMEKSEEGMAESMETAESSEAAWRFFLSGVHERQERELQHWEAQELERRDYYMMWTHQIKTPISAMKLLFERPGFQDRDSFLMKEELFKIEQYAEMVLAFQRLESISSDLVLEGCALQELVRQAVRKYSVLFINKGLGLDLEETDLCVVTDEKWFVFSLEQLLSNSIKYTRQGSIAVRIRREEEIAVLELEDTGIGIREADLPRIFEKGFTGYNGRLDKKSTGIGLYLCRRIFDSLSIGVKVESREGIGTKVILRIPVKKS